MVFSCKVFGKKWNFFQAKISTFCKELEEKGLKLNIETLRQKRLPVLQKHA